MTQDEMNLLHSHLNGTIGEADAARLQSLLRENAEARRMLRDFSTVDAKLSELSAANAATLQLLAAPDAIPAQLPHRLAWAGWLSWRPLTAAAAAGMVIGLCSASMVWAYIGPNAGRAITLLQESFESGPPPLVTGIPVEAGRWSGDYSEVVGEFQGVKPASGGKMLRFLRADYEGKPRGDGYMADLFRVIDLRDSQFDVTSGNACVSTEARFRSLPQDGAGSLKSCISLYALDALPEPGERHEFLLKPRDGLPAAGDGTQNAGATILATSTRREISKLADNSWQVVRSELRMPPGARFLMVHLHAWLVGPQGERTPQPVEFAGLFVDDVRVTLTHRPPLP